MKLLLFKLKKDKGNRSEAREHEENSFKDFRDE